MITKDYVLESREQRYGRPKKTQVIRGVSSVKTSKGKYFFDTVRGGVVRRRTDTWILAKARAAKSRSRWN